MNHEYPIGFQMLFSKSEVILNAASAREGGGPARSEGPRGMQGRRPDASSARTGCFDSVPSAACAHDGTPLSMTPDFFATNLTGSNEHGL